MENTTGRRSRIEGFALRNSGFGIAFMAWFAFHYAHDLILATVVRLFAVDITDYLWVVFIVSLGMTFLTKFLSRFIKVGS